ncbi:MAG: hypothetical protein PHC45_05615 [Clostridiaceae bacterium]|nr:hypothetical protein [Clostridiaceae bacterium]
MRRYRGVSRLISDMLYYTAFAEKGWLVRIPENKLLKLLLSILMTLQALYCMAIAS